MSDFDTLLFPVFDALRRKGVPLGVSDYLAVLEAIHLGLGLEDHNSFRNLCCLLWAKSKEDQELFDIEFAELVEPRLKSLLRSPLRSKSASGDINRQPRKEFSYTSSANSTVYTNESDEEFEDEHDLSESNNQVTEAESSDPTSIKREEVVPTEYSVQRRRYSLMPSLPFSQREMTGIWRQLKRPQRTGIPEDLDIEGTIEQISRTGMFIQPTLQPRRRNLARLVVLVDQMGSMVPLTLWINALIESISRGGLLGKISLYYFHDCPGRVLYQYPSLTNPLPLEGVLDSQAKGNSVLIISDAGAARGYYDGIRLTETQEFILNLSSYTYLYAWLNPIPSKRWRNSTAEGVAKLIPMFYLDREGLNDVVNILRGHPFPPEIGIYG